MPYTVSSPINTSVLVWPETPLSGSVLGVEQFSSLAISMSPAGCAQDWPASLDIVWDLEIRDWDL